jgi:hypothetical protein
MLSSIPRSGITQICRTVTASDDNTPLEKKNVWRKRDARASSSDLKLQRGDGSKMMSGVSEFIKLFLTNGKVDYLHRIL